MPTKPLRISDHAVLRYAERIMGLPVEAIKDRLTSATKGFLKDSRFSIGECVVVIRDNTLVTVFEKDIKKMKKAAKRS